MRELRLTQVTWLAEGVVRLEFTDPGGAELPAWEPGAHLSLRLPNGLTREYSLCGDPGDRRRYAVAVQREKGSRGGSACVHERLRVGDLVEVAGPQNDFPLEDAPAYVLVAGGIGITPIKAMAETLAARGARWRLFHCGAARARMAFTDELSALGDVVVHADDEAGGPPDLAAVLAGLPADALVYCCGPEPLIQAVEAAMADPTRLRVERFRAPEPPKTGGDTAFTVTCGRSGRSLTVEPGVSVLATLRAAGMDLPSSCEEGICGTCETRVLTGEPDHRDFLLTDAERAAGGSMMLCVSRSRGPELVLDL
ncbi:PDR/VanB family oxidoreductase [Actinoallomurus soli]|uniref:PDR/VanB family oxidoreductase n=1 Tax=Actinoallomurus soli TaxID=2952535 RepID=UPI002093CEE8|nr:PDR/VanB family oxidoreductase [Actinoallomurus soli]MCO5972233.1 PDR/VanB family oxidoreductase [Actinoallomurus soli]